MIWIYPEYGGQIATRFGDHVVLRTGLTGKRAAGAWEVYNLITDPNETTDLAGTHPELIEKAKQIFAASWSENKTFSMDKQKSLN